MVREATSEAASAQFGNYYEQRFGPDGAFFVDSGTPVRPNDTFVQVVTTGSIGGCIHPCGGQIPLSAFQSSLSQSFAQLQNSNAQN